MEKVALGPVFAMLVGCLLNVGSMKSYVRANSILPNKLHTSSGNYLVGGQRRSSRAVSSTEATGNHVDHVHYLDAGDGNFLYLARNFIVFMFVGK